MPQAPNPECYFCAGTGHVLAERADEAPRILTPGQQCLCTVTPQEVVDALPGLFAEILNRVEGSPG